MDFKATTIAPSGRNKYGNYISSGNVTKSVQLTSYAGNGTTGGNTGGAGAETGSTDTNFLLFLSKTNGNFEEVEIAAQPQTDNTKVIGYKGTLQAETYVGNIQGNTPTGSTPPANYSITGLTSGITVHVNNNGTSATSIDITISSDIQQLNGSLIIPCNVVTDGTYENEDSIWEWEAKRASGKTMTLALEYVYNIKRNASSVYVLDLTNENAGVNVNSAGTIYSASTATLACTAQLFYGEEVYSAATYTASTLPMYNAHGYHINTNSGVLSWDSNFGFDGANLPIVVTAMIDGDTIATKTMTINKNYPGVDGKDAVTKWIVLSANEAKVNTVTLITTPSAITAYVMKQVGANQPERITGETIYYSYGNYEPVWVIPSSGVTVPSNESHINFALRKGNTSSGEIYESETVQILQEIKGDPGPSGATGESGISAYRLSLSNDNASINCDNKGVPYPTAVKPTCTGKVWYGATLQSAATYNIQTTATGVTSSVTNGVLTITCGNNFNFSGNTTAINISGYTDSTLRDFAVMTITKSIEGKKGSDAVSYWMDFNYTEVILEPNTSTVTPNLITVTAKTQTGGNVPVSYDGDIKYAYFKRSDGQSTNMLGYPSTGLPVTQNDVETYSRARFYLYSGSTMLDYEDVDFLKEGLNGAQGERGYTGCIYRRSKWETDKNYHNDVNIQVSSLEPRYIDIVFDKDMALIGVDDVHCYECLSSHTSSSAITYTDTRYWRQIETATTPYYSPLILSQQISSEMIDVNSLAANEAFINKLKVKELYTDSYDSSGTTVGHLEIHNDTIQSFGSDGSPALYLHGDNLTSGVTIGSTAVTDYQYIVFSKTASAATTEVLNTTFEEALYTSKLLCSLNITQGGNTILMPNIYVAATGNAITEFRDNKFSFYAYIFAYNRTTNEYRNIAYHILRMEGSKSDEWEKQISGVKFSLPKGLWEIRVSYAYLKYPISMTVSGISYTLVFNTTLSSTQSARTFYVEYGYNTIEMASNGFRVAYSADTYFKAENGTYEIRNGAYGLKIGNYKLQYSDGGSNYASREPIYKDLYIPLRYAASITSGGSRDNTYYRDGLVSDVVVARTAVGTYTITNPDNWDYNPIITQSINGDNIRNCFISAKRTSTTVITVKTYSGNTLTNMPFSIQVVEPV